MTGNGRRNDHDSVVIYWSEADGCYVAHSLRTDQIGMGQRIVDALADVMKAVRQVRELAQTQPGLTVYHDAPREIQQLAARAEALPLELSEIAHKMAHGEWPVYLGAVEVETRRDTPLTTPLTK